MKLRKSILTLAVMAALASTTMAQEPLKVIVTSVSGGSVFINQGRTAGVTVGSRVRFTPIGAAPVEGVVIDISSSSARIEIYQQADPPPLGTVGALTIYQPPAPTTAPSTSGATTSTTQPSTQPATTQVVPAHAPWLRNESSRTSDMPLLAPAFAKPASERRSTFHGRIYTSAQISQDNNTDSRFTFARVGTDWTWTNPFQHGGEIRFNGSVDHRQQDVQFGNDSSSDDLVLNRFSYASGGEQYSPYRMELGRFTSYYLPEAGMFDGFEYAVRLQSGLDVGGGIGAYPQPSTDRKEGDDLGFHVFADFKTENSGMLAWTLGYQKTWHKGDPDKDTLFARTSILLNKAWWLYSSVQADVYTSSDVVKTTGIDLTSAFIQARYAPDSLRGASLSFSHFTFQETKTDEFVFIPTELIRHGKNDRLELSVWRNLTDNIRPTARASYFSSQQDDGFGGELDLDWSSFLKSHFDFHGAVFYNQASNETDMGLRTDISFRKGDFDGSVGYEMLRYQVSGGLTDTGYLTRHAIRGSLGWQIGNWYASFTADQYFGNNEDTTVFGTFVEYRF